MRSLRRTYEWNADIIFILSGAVILGVALFFVTDRWEILTGLVAAGIALAIGVSQTRIAHDRMLKELFTEFNNRYDRLNNDLKQIIELNDSADKRHVVVDYFNLCAEEYYWHKNHRIPHEIWDAWLSGIRYYKKNDFFCEVARDEEKYDSSYYGFFKNVWHKL